MTPFGRKLRELRAARGLTMKEMAEALRVTPAYLSALEHGKRGRPSWRLVQAIIGYFNVIWDEAEELERLARLSHPRIVLDTSDLAPQATELANRLAEEIAGLGQAEIAEMLALLDRRKKEMKR
ncbi:helix-turn-helix transcriptional regulator [Parvibaculum sp.]|jgi:transcriptional regulator with XRE-family HTH domain|uniref:helix-turn-helix domain-containing protein n=1 Tax=Parvibaculum sp. TaxID=2024848 RepID=UPI000C615E24|nr:helix-turn-helix transcriptional regulator [Parvibaculum sp.]MAM95882.1 transcriptional regulator [Parvibaculum sp.]|tara:strand:- start:38537 stop:38908 length:372 start_codon:yes stop_codon:yes gene_type:complete